MSIKFCDECGNFLVRDVDENDEIIFKCSTCGKSFISDPYDTLIYYKKFKNNYIPELPKNFHQDRTNIKVKKKCSSGSCEGEYSRGTRLGDYYFLGCISCGKVEIYGSSD